MRTLAAEASQEKRRISRYKVTAAELKVSSGEWGAGGGGALWGVWCLETCESQSCLYVGWSPIRSSTAAS